MIKLIQGFECNDEGEFAIHASAKAENATRTSSLDLASMIDHVKDVVRNASTHAGSPVVTYSYNGQLNITISTFVDYSDATRDAGFYIIRALEEDGWDIV